MEDFDPKTWIDLVQHNPILIVILGGMFVGNSFTQVVKKTYIAFGDPTQINEDRYRASVMWLAMLSTVLATYGLFHAIIFTDAHGFGKVVAIGNGIMAPFTYRVVLVAIRWKFPAIADALGENGTTFKTAAQSPGPGPKS